MTSTFAWLDFDEPARQRMREIVEMLRQEGSIDELGLGRMRDAFSDRLFPGTSVLWRRAGYLLFVPWMYQQFERDGIGSVRPEAAARRVQAKLRDGLRDGGATDGLIGARARFPVSPPDVIIWAALSQWGVRESSAGTLAQYRGTLGPNPLRAAEDAPVLGSVWHPRLPPMPAEFPDVDGFELRKEDAEFLSELVLADDDPVGSPGFRRSDSLMADLLRREQLIGADAAWTLPLSKHASDGLRQAVHVAGCFSDVMHGANLLYARLLAEARKKEEVIKAVDDHIGEWIGHIAGSRAQELEQWAHRLDVCFAVIDEQRPTRPSERGFVTEWTRLVLADPSGLTKSAAAGRLVVEREARSKRAKARLATPEKDRGDGGNLPAPLGYRWSNAYSIAEDIRTGLGR